MATDNSTATINSSLNISRAGMIFASIKDIAEELEFAEDIEFDAVKKLLAIIGLSKIGHDLTCDALEVIDEREADHAN